MAKEHENPVVEKAKQKIEKLRRKLEQKDIDPRDALEDLSRIILSVLADTDSTKDGAAIHDFTQFAAGFHREIGQENQEEMDLTETVKATRHWFELEASFKKQKKVIKNLAQAVNEEGVLLGWMQNIPTTFTHFYTRTINRLQGSGFFVGTDNLRKDMVDLELDQKLIESLLFSVDFKMFKTSPIHQPLIQGRKGFYQPLSGFGEVTFDYLKTALYIGISELRKKKS